MPNPPEGKRIFFPALNELRAFAALTVLLHHVRIRSMGLGVDLSFGAEHDEILYTLGLRAVNLFFTLSGFLITYLLLAEYKKTSTISVRKFYMRRILRIWPLYYLIILIAFIGLPLLLQTGFFGPEDFGSEANQNVVSRYFYVYIFLFIFFLPNIATYGIAPLQGVSQAWSIGVEEQFYLIWPNIVKWVKGKILPVVVTLFVAKVAFNLVFPFLPIPPEKHQYLQKLLVDMLGIEFMFIGAIAAYALFHQKKWILQVKSRWIPVLICGYVLATLALGTHALADCFVFAILILNAAQRDNSFTRAKWLSYWGDISYGLYMYHPIVILLLFPVVNTLAPEVFSLGWVSYAIMLVIIVAATVGVCHLSYQYFEKPFLRLKERFATIKSGKTVK